MKAPTNTKVLLLIGGYCVALGAFLFTSVKIIGSFMTTSTAGKNLIKQFEGLRLNAYYDSAGVLTIGYGHTGSDVKAGMTITQAKADELFNADIRKFELGVSSYLIGVKTTQAQFDALVSLAYNIGLGNFSKSTLLKKVKANPNDPSITTEFQKWVYAGGQRLTGLVTRRNKEANYYFS